MGFASRKLLAKSKSVEVAPPTSGDLYWGDAVLLLHADKSNNQTNNSFLDSSTNNFTITRNGTPTQGSFTPFLNNYIYDPLIHGGSGYFNGTTDYLTSSSTTISNFGTNPFTVECWVYKTGTNTGSIYDGRPTGSASSGFNLSVNANNTINVIVGSSYVFTSTATMNLNSWNHIAVSRLNTSTNGCSLYLNGVNIGTFTFSTNIDNGFNVIGAVSYTPVGNAPWNGYISNFRVTKGAALYTSNFTPPTSPVTLTSNGGATPSTAPTSGQVSLLCDFTNAGIFDSTKKNNLVTVGDAKVSNAVVKYGSGSMYFDGTGDYLQIDTLTNSGFNFTSSDNFTLECWFYASVLSPTTFSTLFGCHDGTNINSWGVYVRTDGVTIYASAGRDGGGGTISTNTWYHFAASRNNGLLKVFLNGNEVASVTRNINYTNTQNRFCVARDAGPVINNGFFTGYIDDLRITKGVARYTSNFTPPGPLPDGPLTALATTLELNDFSGYIVQEDSSYILLDT